jgi:hypothetical protein
LASFGNEKISNPFINEFINILLIDSNIEITYFIYYINIFISIRYIHTPNKTENYQSINRPKWMDSSVKVYENILNKINRNSILDENKGKSDIYLWFNHLNGKKYIGQSKDLGNRKQGRIIK